MEKEKEKNPPKQAGGTLIGLMLGVILGLGVAVGVAVMIFKTPLPFTHKGAQSERISPNKKNVDPNQSMYSKKPAPTPSSTPAPAKPARPTSPTPAPVAQERKQPTEAERAETARAEAALRGVEEKKIYYLQAGAFRERADADGMRAKLLLLGYEATITARQAGADTLHRVRIGPFTQMDDMSRARSKLSDNGIDVSLVRIGK